MVGWLTITGYGTCDKGSTKNCTFSLPVAYTGTYTYSIAAATRVGGDNYRYVVRHYGYRSSNALCGISVTTDSNSYDMSGVRGSCITIGY